MTVAPRRASPAAVARAQALLPALAELIENQDPCLKHLDFNQIEASSAAIGDVLARVLMQEAVAQRPAATEPEVQTAYEQALRKAGTSSATAATLPEAEVRRMRKKRKLKTMRGPIEIEREYLYFPALKTGIFPPRSKA